MKDLRERPSVLEHKNGYLKGLEKKAEEDFVERRKIITNSFDKSY